MKKWKKCLLAFFSVLLILQPALQARAEVPYKTYTIDGYGYVTETQTAYTPKTTFSKIGEHSLVNPYDLKVTEDGYIYIADAGAGVVYVSTLEGEYVKTIGEGELSEPYGVFVTEEKDVYVADHSGKVVVFDDDGEVSAVYTKPDHPCTAAASSSPSKSW